MGTNTRKMIYDTYAEFYDYIYGGIDKPIEEHPSFQLVEWILSNYNFSKSHKILDLGSGTGRILLPLTKMGYDITGYEPFEKMRAITIQKAEQQKIEINVKEGSFQNLDEENAFDLILSINGTFAYVHSTDDAVKSFENIKKALKPGGIFVIDVLNFYGIIGNYKHPELTEVEIDGRKGQAILKLDIDIDRSLWIHDLHLYLVSENGIQHIIDYHELALISPRELKLLGKYNDLELINYFNAYEQPMEEDVEGKRCIMVFRKQPA